MFLVYNLSVSFDSYRLLSAFKRFDDTDLADLEWESLFSIELTTMQCWVKQKTNNLLLISNFY
jgi:hypothetical protein